MSADLPAAADCLCGMPQNLMSDSGFCTRTLNERGDILSSCSFWDKSDEIERISMSFVYVHCTLV